MDSCQVKTNSTRLHTYAQAEIAAISAIFSIALHLTGWIIYILTDNIGSTSGNCSLLPALFIPILISLLFIIIYSCFLEQCYANFHIKWFVMGIWVATSVLTGILYYKVIIPDGETVFTAAENLQEVMRYLIKTPFFILLYTIMPITLLNVVETLVPFHYEVKKENTQLAPTRTGRRTRESKLAVKHKIRKQAPLISKGTKPETPIKRATKAKEKERTNAALQSTSHRIKIEKRKDSPKGAKSKSAQTHGKREAPSTTAEKKKHTTSKNKNSTHKRKRAKRRKKKR